jgi:hypothetical protein
MPTLGLVVEGDFDINAYSALIHRENPLPIKIHERPCGKSVSGRFVNILTALKYAQPATERAVVVSDAQGRDRITWRTELQSQAQHLALPFPVEYVVVVEELEAILLCDPRAIEAVCAARGNPIQIPNVTHNPETLDEPKGELVRTLGLGGVRYTKVVAGEIAFHANLAQLTYWSRSYRDFRVAVKF